LKTRFDRDCTPSSALEFGSALHKCLELCNHRVEKFSSNVLKEACLPYASLTTEDYGKILHMLDKYFAFNKHHNCTILKTELKISLFNNTFMGYIDAIVSDGENWWIRDTKTCAQHSSYVPSHLHRDEQVIFYHASAQSIADSLKLSIDDYAGFRYMELQKPSSKYKDGESLSEYCDRLNNSKAGIKEYVILKEKIPVLDTNNLGIFSKVLEEADILEARFNTEKYIGEPNFGSCFDFMKPCEYWSQCHNNLFSEPVSQTLTIDSEPFFIAKKEEDDFCFDDLFDIDDELFNF